MFALVSQKFGVKLDYFFYRLFQIINWDFIPNYNTFIFRIYKFNAIRFYSLKISTLDVKYSMMENGNFEMIPMMCLIVASIYFGMRRLFKPGS
jgi:uncharacterized membrane protein